MTHPEGAGTINQSSESVFDWLAENVQQAESGPASGVPAGGGDRAETLLLDLVRTGIENDFERVVFPEYPELREVKELLQREGAQWASLSGSGSTLYGVFASADDASAAAERMRAAGHAAVATTSLTREAYWNAMERRGSSSRGWRAMRRAESADGLQSSRLIARSFTGRSTNGRSSAFGALCLGSNPSRPARIQVPVSQWPVVSGTEGPSPSGTEFNEQIGVLDSGTKVLAQDDT